MVVFGQFHGRFHRLGTVALEGKLVDFPRGDFCELIGQLHCRYIGKLAGCKIGQFAHLIVSSLGQFLSPVSEMNRAGDPGIQIYVGLSVLVGHTNAFAASDDGYTLANFVLGCPVQNQM